MKQEGVQLSLVEAPIIPRTSDEYYTPRWIFDALDVEFDLDVASPPEGMGFVPAHRRFTAADDGLSQPWEGFVWMNPPFSNMRPWVERWVQHGNGIMLGPVTRGGWIHLVFRSSSFAYLTHNLRFYTPGGECRNSMPIPVFMAAIGDHGVRVLRRFCAITPKASLLNPDVSP